MPPGSQTGRQEGSRRTDATAEGSGEEERSEKTTGVGVGTAGRGERGCGSFSYESRSSWR